MLVVPDSSYCNRVPIALGNIHIDMFIKLATQEELGKLKSLLEKRGSTHMSCHVMSTTGK